MISTVLLGYYESNRNKHFSFIEEATQETYLECFKISTPFD